MERIEMTTRTTGKVRQTATDEGVFSRAARLATGENVVSNALGLASGDNVFSGAVATMNAGGGSSFAKAVRVMNALDRSAATSHPAVPEGRDDLVTAPAAPPSALPREPELDAGAQAVAQKAADAAQRVHRVGRFAQGP